MIGDGVHRVTLAAVLNQMDEARRIRAYGRAQPVHAAFGTNRHPWSWCGQWTERRPLGGYTNEHRMADDLALVTCYGCLRSLRAQCEASADAEAMRANRIERLRDE